MQRSTYTASTVYIYIYIYSTFINIVTICSYGFLDEHMHIHTFLPQELGNDVHLHSASEGSFKLMSV